MKLVFALNDWRETQATEGRGHRHGSKTKGIDDNRKTTTEFIVRTESSLMHSSKECETTVWVSVYTCVFVFKSTSGVNQQTFLSQTCLNPFWGLRMSPAQPGRESAVSSSLQKVMVTVRWHFSGICISTGNIGLHKHVGSKRNPVDTANLSPWSSLR